MSDPLAAHALPLSSTDPDADDGAAAALATTLADVDPEADVVGLGEATHGTRECFDLKHRLLRSLVADHGVRTVTFEADVTAMAAADAYVRGGGDDGDGDVDDDSPADPESALADLDKWQWQTEAVADLLSWLHEFNADRPESDRVRVRGVDLSDPSRPAAALAALLSHADVVPVPNDLETLAAAGAPPDDDGEREQYLTRSETALSAVRKRLDDDREAFVGATSAAAWAEARHLCRVGEQNCEWHRVRHEHDGPHEAGMAARDRFMAENVAWVHDHDPGRVAVWAHNSHVQRGTFDDGTAWTDAETMGEHMADEFGDGYRVLGFDVGRGSFRAHVRGEDGGPHAASVGDPATGTLTAHLDAVAAGDDGPEAPFAVDLAAAAAEAAADGVDDAETDADGANDAETDADAADAADSDLLAPEGRIRWVGSVYDPEADAGHHYQSTDLPASYDWLCFLAESTPTRPL